MFRPNTVFVIGAGASAEVGLPVGVDLMKEISKRLQFKAKFRDLLSGDPHIYAALQQCYPEEINIYFEKGRQISEGLTLATSIDNYLFEHGRDDEIRRLSKVAILTTLLEKERNGALKIIDNKYINFDSSANSWFGKFAKKLFEQRSIDKIFNGISVINFNYDRCLEHYLRFAVQRYYHVSIDEAESILSGMEIVHPYGGLGELASMRGRESNKIAFGNNVPSEHLFEFSENIRTFHEQDRDADDFKKIKRIVNQADHFIFLGFGFLPQNIDLLRPSRRSKSRSVKATAYCASDFNRKEIARQLKLNFSSHPSASIEITTETCSAFFDEYWMGL